MTNALVGTDNAGCEPALETANMKRSGSLTVSKDSSPCPLLAEEKEESFFPRLATELRVKALPGNWRDYFRDWLTKATREAM
jgi:hypothetical protein